MRWPSDHPALVDPALAPWALGAEELCPDAEVGSVLRYLPGRRVASQAQTDHGTAVLKVFARPRARGNHRRLQLLGATSAAELVPTSFGADRSGHVSLVRWVPGQVLDQLPDTQFVRAASRTGEALAALHRCGAVLDRSWTVTDEVDLLVRRAPDATKAAVAAVIRCAESLRDAPLVPSHRDCHPRQVVWDGSAPHWIDLDDTAMAPAGLDVGNMVAHLRRDAALGLRSISTTRAAIEGFLSGYGRPPRDVAAWERLSLARLAGLAETRHDRADSRDALLTLLEETEAMAVPA